MNDNIIPFPLRKGASKSELRDSITEHVKGLRLRLGGNPARDLAAIEALVFAAEEIQEWNEEYAAIPFAVPETVREADRDAILAEAKRVLVAMRLKQEDSAIRLVVRAAERTLFGEAFLPK